MNIKPKYIPYNIRRMCKVSLIEYVHENDVETMYLEINLTDDGEPIELLGSYDYSASMINKATKALIKDDVVCSLNESGNVVIKIDDFHTLGAQDILIELTVSNQNRSKVLVPPFPLWIHVNASILDDAQVTPESQGTVPELLEEAKEALENAGDYENLENKPQINGHELVGDKSSDDLGLQGKLTAGKNITINANGEISASGGYQPKIDSTHKLSSDLVDDTGNTNKFVTSTDKTNWSAKYDKPSGGIPKTDLASDVQTSLGKADTALQEHQDISGKANKISVVQTSASTIEINPNTFYKFGEVASLNITLASITDNTIYNEYMFEFVSGTTATTLTLPSSIKWLETPTIDANKIYQCSIVDNIGILVGVTNV